MMFRLTISVLCSLAVDFINPVISRNDWFWTLSKVKIADFDADDNVVDTCPWCGRIVPIYTLFKTVSAAPHWVPASFVSKANMRLAFVSALLIATLLQVCFLSSSSV